MTCTLSDNTWRGCALYGDDGGDDFAYMTNRTPDKYACDAPRTSAPSLRRMILLNGCARLLGFFELILYTCFRNFLGLRLSPDDLVFDGIRADWPCRARAAKDLPSRILIPPRWPLSGSRLL